MVSVVELITKKREGGELSAGEIDWLVQGFTRGDIPDYQFSALLMAIVWRGMNARETTDLTLAMANSGGQLNIRQSLSPAVDKHSTGGVGDKVTLAVAPLVAACGLPVAKMSGRGLGHTGGTIDKLESISGFRTSLSQDEFWSILRAHHLVIAGQSSDLAPADGKMYALRDVTGTVDSIPLIASSIMSKKLAIGASHLLLDVKVGSGAFMKTLPDAETLAHTMVEIGNRAGVRTAAVISAMDQPLGRAVGNALELAEAIHILQGKGPADVTTLCHHEAATLLQMTGLAANAAEAETQVLHAINSGAALARFAAVVRAQGGDPRQVEAPDLLPTAPVRFPLLAPQTGYIAHINAEQIGLATMKLGAGRFKKGDPIDHATGLILNTRVGDHIEVGQPMLEIHARSKEQATAIQEELLNAYQWSEAPVSPGPLIYSEMS
ncbi:MAG TPA: thymidine phosphorylase [Ktedonobacterales bacterium]|nr:thymidine phosphorylase [Ktedonobacterales bacterium]